METTTKHRIGVDLDNVTYSTLKRILPYGLMQPLLRKLIEDFATELSVRGQLLCYEYLGDKINFGRLLRESEATDGIYKNDNE